MNSKIQKWCLPATNHKDNYYYYYWKSCLFVKWQEIIWIMKKFKLWWCKSLILWLKFNEFVTLFETIEKLEIQLFPVVHKLQSLQEKKNKTTSHSTEQTNLLSIIILLFHSANVTQRIVAYD